MSSKYINNGSYATSGYTLSGVFQSITIRPEGSIGGVGVIGSSREAYTIVNRGKIVATGGSSYSYGVKLLSGGSVTNGSAVAVISGYFGVEVLGAAGFVSNAGIIEGVNGLGVAVEWYIK